MKRIKLFFAAGALVVAAAAAFASTRTEVGEKYYFNPDDDEYVYIQEPILDCPYEAYGCLYEGFQVYRYDGANNYQELSDVEP